MVSEETVDKMTSILVEFCERFYGWEASVAKLGKLSAPQLRTICVIGRNENIRMKDIADRMELTTGTVTVMIDRLQVMGLVERCRNESDRRSYKILLSEKGRKYYEEHRKRQRELVRKLANKVSDADRETCERVLMEFIHSI
ncbi:MAG: MarR family transcriptional regulator [Pyramidobacter sp.]|nr:MarR family transcriptional regulator [Pyramidobacter sp.]MBP3752306.1 MarR family transcriptional regulator [Pyramidobacter sp.]MBP3835668.1 MarR family transcriptional regulator [Pyramidobacter sp.]MBQ4491260.1 MarR family transcriptional regulator [Pyramidobacter sp.]MBQ8091329.1 MarR family transcriptional regulator [Pyramidobacter sp.]